MKLSKTTLVIFLDNLVDNSAVIVGGQFGGQFGGHCCTILVMIC